MKTQRIRPTDWHSSSGGGESLTAVKAGLVATVWSERHQGSVIWYWKVRNGNRELTSGACSSLASAMFMAAEVHANAQDQQPSLF